MTDEEWIKEGLTRGYMIPLKDKYSLTGNFHRNYIPLESGLQVISKEIATNPSQAIITQQEKILHTNELFMEFIKQCQIPTRTSNGRGGFYWINRFHKDAAKEFARILSKEQVNLAILVASTKLYYLQTKECANTIANYIVLGIWRSGYQEMMLKLNSGEIQNYIKDEIRGESNTLDL